MNTNRRTLLATVAAAGIAGCSEYLPQQNRPDDSTAEPTDAADESGEQRPDERPENPAEYDPAFDFHDVEEWEAGGGELSVDAETHLTGEHAVRVDVAEDEAWARVERSGLDLDLRERRFNLVCQVHLSEPGGQSIDIAVEDREENELRFRARAHKTDEETTFMPMDVGLRDRDPETAIDLSSISRVRIQSRFDEGVEGTLWLDSLDTVALPETPLLLIQWDDGFVSQYTEGFPIQREYDVPATTFVNPENVGDGDDRLTLDQLEELQAAGWEVGSHLLHHDNLTELDPDEQERQIVESKEWLVDRGFERGAEYFAYPYGEHDQSSYDLVGEHHALGMIGGEPGYGSPRNLPAIARSSERTFEEATEYVDLLVEWGGIGGLFWHALPEETPTGEFEEILRYVADRRDAGELDVVTLSELEELVEPVPAVMPWRS
ncbi:MAG: polysaccharide deacetylase family protein [Halalkalicoccus sp.]